MGNPKYSEPKEVVKTASEQFIEWLNGIEFKNDELLTIALFEIRDECAARLSLMEGEDGPTPEVEQPEPEEKTGE
jgi:hypothetical protein